MNTDKLNEVIDNYLKQFARGAGVPHDEMWKWRLAYVCKQWDIEAPDFLEMFRKCFKGSGSLLSSGSHWQPRAGIENLCREDRGNKAEVVRGIFRGYVDKSPEDMDARGRSMYQFIAGINSMEDEILQEKYRYKVDNRAATTILGILKPASDYMYKAKAAEYLAAYVEFGDSFGYAGDFRLPVYYRFCNEVAEYLITREDVMNIVRDELLRQAEKYNMPGLEEVDPNHHILVYDLMYRTQMYGFRENHPVDSKKVSAGRGSSAKRTEWEKEERRKDLIIEIEEYTAFYESMKAEFEKLKNTACEGIAVRHAVFGEGTISRMEEMRVLVNFKAGEKKLSLKALLEKGEILDNEFSGIAQKLCVLEKEVSNGDTHLKNLNRSLRELGE